jgi:hypothetical protein
MPLVNHATFILSCTSIGPDMNLHMLGEDSRTVASIPKFECRSPCFPPAPSDHPSSQWSTIYQSPHYELFCLRYVWDKLKQHNHFISTKRICAIYPKINYMVVPTWHAIRHGLFGWGLLAAMILFIPDRCRLHWFSNTSIDPPIQTNRAERGRERERKINPRKAKKTNN